MTSVTLAACGNSVREIKDSRGATTFYRPTWSVAVARKKYFQKESMGTPSPESRSCDSGYKMDIILHEGQHWFRAADLTRHLAYSNGREAVIRHVK